MTSPARAAAVAAAAESFVRAHADLEALAAEIGPDAAATSDLNDRVVALHRDLESLVLGGTVVPGRRSSPVASPTIAFYQCVEPGCDGRLEVVHAHSGDAQVDLSKWSIVEVGAVAASRTQMALRAIEVAGRASRSMGHPGSTVRGTRGTRSVRAAEWPTASASGVLA